MSTDWLGTGSFSLTPTVAGADTLSNPTVAELFALAYVYNGTTWDRLRGDATNGMYVNVKAIAAGSYDQTGTIYSGATALTVNYAAIAAATSGDNTLLAADATHKIRVLSIAIVASAAVNLYFTSAAGGTVIFGGSTNKIQLGANGGFVLPYNPHGWFQNSSTNQLLNMNLSGAVAVSGGFTYVLV